MAQYVGMSEIFHKSHYIKALFGRLVFPTEYRRTLFDDYMDFVLREICLDIEKRYQQKFLGIGTDKD